MIGENQAKIVTAGGIDVVVKGIDAHINDENLCFIECVALSAMTLNGKSIVSLATKKMIIITSNMISS